MGAIIIPARIGSSRLAGKMMIDLAGSPLIAWTVRAALKTKLRVVVATDNNQIAEAATDAGAEIIMTGHCNNGTERCAEAARKLGLKGVVVNWQGDSPLVPPEWAVALAKAVNLGQPVTTPVQLCSTKQTHAMKADFFCRQPGGTFAAFDENFDALYFSKSPIPYGGPHWLHVGMYAYTVEALQEYGTNASTLEKSEKLEQLRWLEKGGRIVCLPMDGKPIWEVNNAADIRIVEGALRENV